MHRTRSGRQALRRLATACTLGAVCAAVSVASAAPAAHPAVIAPAAGVSVRVEGPHSTLLPATTVALSAGTIAKDGIAADACSSQSAAGALELATRGDWSGTWSATYSAYFLNTIQGVAFPGTGAEFWAFWINDAPATQGICGVVPKPGDSILFFPDCFGKSCPKSAGVLGLKAPAAARAGRPVTVTVTVYSDASGAASPAQGVTVAGGGAHAKTAADGTAHLTFASAGRVTLRASAPHAVRTEATVCVESTASRKCG